MQEIIKRSLDAVQTWVEDRDYKGYDPGDGLTSFLRPLTCGNIFAERVLQQAVWKAPVNVRPLVGVKPLDSTKGRGFMAAGYLRRYAATQDTSYRDKAIACLEWLEQAREPGHVGHCWGNHFDFATRSGRMYAHTPTIVWTSLIGHAFIDAYERLGDAHYLEVAESICQWILWLPREKTLCGTCISYTGVFQNSVHNSNLLGAGMLARTWKHRPRDEYRDVAREAVLYTCSRQRPDGSWWYGEDPKYHWIDNFHTGYNLDSLLYYASSTGDDSFREHLKRGYDYFRATFFDDSARPRYYHDRTYPIDIQCAAQAIDTFCAFADFDRGALAMAQRVAQWTIKNMQGRDGHFHYRQYPFMTAKTPYFHWGQSTMFRALSQLFLVRAKLAGSVREAAVTPAAL
jgi:polysaccharide biosynthesis protein VpsJ